MRISIVKRGVAALGALVLLALLFFAALPTIASTQIVRDRIAYELSVWSGYRVSLGEAPILDVWPMFRATLNDVAFHEWSRGDNPPVLEADRLEVSLSALSALRGNVVMSGVSMYRPLLRLTTAGSVIDLPASPGGGRMVRAVEAARKVLETNPDNPDRSALPSDGFGTVEFFDGRIATVNGDEGDIVTSLSGKLTWPSLDRSASLTANGIWRGENISVEATSAQPLMFLAGGNAPVTAALKSPLLNAGFQGTANLSGEAYFEGNGNLSSPSLRRMLEWSKTDIAPGAAIGSVSITSKIQGTSERLRLDTAELNLGGNAGRGVLDISFAEALPSISGTLAFDTLDLRFFLSAFTRLATDQGNIYDQIDTAFADQLSLDLRLSANNATLGGLTLTSLAASTQVKGTLAVFDISDATVFDGSLQAGVRIDTTEETKVVEMRALATDIDAFALAKTLGGERLLPQGRATLSATLKGIGRDWNTVMGNAEGSVSATLGQGVLAGLNLAKFKEKWATGGFFPLSDVSDGELPLRGVDFKATVLGGIARIDKGDLLLDGQVASISGFIPYFGRALALSGSLAPMDADGERGDPDTRFFIGGGWDRPFISPAFPTTRFE